MIMWWVYASYNDHDDCKGNTGAMMYLWKGYVLSKSMDQKLNVLSSTKGELVGDDDMLGYLLWDK